VRSTWRQQDDGGQHHEEDAEIGERRTPRASERLLAPGRNRVDRRHQHLPRHGRQIAADFGPAFALRVGGRLARVGEGELAQLRQLTSIGGIGT
jgi:hypothetical protein